VLEIKDNGCGYNQLDNQGSSWRNGLGNWNMQQLAARFNGELEIETSPGRGTVVRCTIPRKCEMADKIKEAVSK
jgi:signal transduction histidine kinase